MDLPPVSGQGLAAAEAYALRVAAEDGVRSLPVATLREMISRQSEDNVYLVDVRTREEYLAGHIPGFTWFPGGQVVQRSDDVAVVKNTPIVFACDGLARSTLVASWYRQMGMEEVYAVDGGTQAWTDAGLQLATGDPETPVFGLDEAKAKANLISPRELNDSSNDSSGRVTIFVDTSQDFSRGHVPGSRWVSRGWLELQINDAAPSRETPVTVTCADGRLSILSASTLTQMGYRNVSVLDGGMTSWRSAGLDVETGLTGITRPPADVVYSGPDRNYAEMMHYLRWETALGEKYQSAV
jgi:rhodanese-related sulfurtransferase